MTNPRAAYIHVPFCAHHCGYCDFAVIAGRDDLVPAYLMAMERQLSAVLEPVEVDTLYIGGGTPTQLTPRQFDRLLELLTTWFRLAEDAEVTVEANPHGLTREHLRVFRERGGNRVSLGVQSFDDRELQILERDHRAGDIAVVCEMVQSEIPNLSIDLIFAVPGQSLSTWERHLQAAVKLQPSHLSCYGLTIEKGTTFWGRVERGQLSTVNDEQQRAMYGACMDRLETAGYRQYELSNFARPGCESRHNQVYWAGLDFHGFGPGAARLLRGRRETNHRSVTTWLKRIAAGLSPIAESEQLEPEDRARELAMLNLRRTRGIDRSEFARQSGFDIDQLAADTIRQHTARGWLEADEAGVRLTREGRFVADTIMSDFL